MTRAADPRIGTELGPYRIEAVIGRGGMGVVYRAEQLGLARKVALKILAPVLVDDEAFRQRFVRESQMAAAIDHPNILPIYEAGEVDGVYFLAMRFVDGADLETRLRSGPLEPRTGRPTAGPGGLGARRRRGGRARPSGREAGQHPDRVQPRHREGRSRLPVRLRADQASRQPDRPDADGRVHGHARLRGARAGRGPPGRQSHGSVLAGLCRLPLPDRRHAVPARHGHRHRHGTPP